MTKDPRNAVLELLLADIRDVFAKEGGVEISSADLVKALVAIERRPWAERGKNGKRGKPLTQFKLAQMLKPLAIAPGHIGSEARVRGYKLWQFEEAFSRYLPPERSLSSRRIQELAPIIRGSWRLAMRGHDISRVDGGRCSGTLATRWN